MDLEINIHWVAWLEEDTKFKKNINERKASFYGKSLAGEKDKILHGKPRKIDKNIHLKEDIAKENHPMKESIKYLLKRSIEGRWSMARTLGSVVNWRQSVLGWVVVLDFPSDLLSVTLVWFNCLGCIVCCSVLFMYHIFKLMCYLGFKIMNTYAWDNYVWWIIMFLQLEIV